MPDNVPTKVEGLVINWLGGNCPVQAEGTLCGKEFYFRARGNRWALNVGGDVVVDPEWKYEEPYGSEAFAAGWMEEKEALRFIEAAAEMYKNR